MFSFIIRYMFCISSYSCSLSQQTIFSLMIDCSDVECSRVIELYMLVPVAAL